MEDGGIKSGWTVVTLHVFMNGVETFGQSFADDNGCHFSTEIFDLFPTFWCKKRFSQ